MEPHADGRPEEGGAAAATWTRRRWQQDRAWVAGERTHGEKTFGALNFATAAQSRYGVKEIVSLLVW